MYTTNGLKALTGNQGEASDIQSDSKFQDGQEQSASAQTQKGAIESTGAVEQIPNRRLTRSQTGRVAKRPRQDDSPLPEANHKTTRTSTKMQPGSPIPTPTLRGAALSDQSSVPLLPPRQISAPKRSHTPETESSSNIPIEFPTSKLRANLPEPVPNLTKKSRGRRVPTKLADDIGGTNNSKDATRMYVCKVESCGKCFRRGEHLKRHIRSIHTHEKPFKCTYSGCNKHFNRHDNLLQHLKVHRDLAASETSAADDAGSPIELTRNTPSPLYHADQSPPLSQSYHSISDHNDAYDSYETSHKQPRPALYQPPPSSSVYRSYDASYTSISEPTSFRTNMAVSSLRTEIPQSPPTSRD